MEGFIKPSGGTEILWGRLLARLQSSELEGINLILNDASPQRLIPGKINVLWNHHSYDQPSVQNLNNKSYLDCLDKIIYVSHWQAEKFSMLYQNVPDYKTKVIKNAIETMELCTKPPRIKLIYASTPWRGLDILLDAFALLRRDDVELDIYSSTLIYGSEFYRENEIKFKGIFDKAKSMKGVRYIGLVDNQTMRDAFQQSHILAYPSTWQETSCLCAIEAAMAGCQVVTTDLGALTETLADWGTYVRIDRDRNRLVKSYAAALNSAIEEFWTDGTQSRLSMQHHYYKRFWSWDVRINEWRTYLSSVRSGHC